MDAGVALAKRAGMSAKRLLPLLLLEQRPEQVDAVDLGVAPTARFARRRLHGLGGFDGQSVRAEHRFDTRS